MDALINIDHSSETSQVMTFTTENIADSVAGISYFMEPAIKSVSGETDFTSQNAYYWFYAIIASLTVVIVVLATVIHGMRRRDATESSEGDVGELSGPSGVYEAVPVQVMELQALSNQI